MSIQTVLRTHIDRTIFQEGITVQYPVEHRVTMTEKPPPPPPPPPHTITLGVVHYRPFTTPLSSFEVGFRSALDLLCKMNPSYKVVYLNIYNLEGTVPGSNKYNTIIQQYHDMDVLLIKSNWNWIPDTFIRNGLHVTSTQPKCLLISGVAPLPERDEDVQYYSALVYETEWYNAWQHLQQRHPNVHQAFGIDTHIMKKSVVEHIKTWDLIFVGWMASWKRLDLFVEKYQRMCQTALQQEKDTGVPVELPTALAVGKLDATEDSRTIVEMLEKNGVVVKSEVPYNELAGLIHRSKEMYIPSTIQGGGERAVLEGKACGVAVTVEPDNFKLLELIELEQVPSHLDYANALHEMLQSVVVKEVTMGERRRREL
jgi:glycosyltransferase involved in cell wall biosynthesis